MISNFIIKWNFFLLLSNVWAFLYGAKPMTISVNYVFWITEGELLNSKCIATRLLVVTASTICLAVIIKWYFGGGVCRSKARLDGMSALWKKFIICLARMMAFWGGGLITNPHKGDLSTSRPERYSFRAVLFIREMWILTILLLIIYDFQRKPWEHIYKLFWILNFSCKWTSEKESLTKIYYLSWIFCKLYQF